MKFHIRDLLWLTVVVAAGTMWWIEHRAVQTSQSRVDRLTANLNAAERENSRLVARDSEFLKLFSDFSGALHRVGIEPAHIFAASHLLDRSWKGFDVIIERRRRSENGDIAY